MNERDSCPNEFLSTFLSGRDLHRDSFMSRNTDKNHLVFQFILLNLIR